MIVGKEVYSITYVSKRVQRSIFYSLCTLMFFVALVMYGVYGSGLGTAPVNTAHAADTLNIWWPTSSAHVQGLQPFKAMVENMHVEQYDMYWQVDGGSLNPMNNSYTEYPHKEAAVNVTGWNWRTNNQYQITFVAKKGEAVISQRSITLYVDSGAASDVRLVMDANQPAPTVALPEPQALQVASPIQPSIADAPLSQTPTLTADVRVWWPTAGSNLAGSQPFKAEVKNMALDQYDMFWQVDNRELSLMSNSTTDYPHKEMMVNVASWNWRGTGPYTLTFIAKDKSGNIVGQMTEQVSVASTNNILTTSGSVVTASQTVPPRVDTSVLPAPVISFSGTTGAILGSVSLYVNSNSGAKRQADQWASSRPSDAQAMRLLAGTPTATWFGNWNSNVYNDVQQLISAAASEGSTPVMVVYNIPGRDCSGGYSRGGASSSDAYRAWVGSIASAIGSNKAIVVLEPDSLADISCLSSGDQQTRLSLLSGAVSALKKNPNTAVYLDAGHSGWVNPGTMAASLKSAGVGAANGFAVNVSNFETAAANTGYGDQVSQSLGGAHYIVDTSRNGTGSDGQWCNPQGRGIGVKPTTSTGNPRIDAFLWLKTPGESDGNCNGGPGAGQWWADYALQLVRNSGQ